MQDFEYIHIGFPLGFPLKPAKSGHPQKKGHLEVDQYSWPIMGHFSQWLTYQLFLVVFIGFQPKVLPRIMGPFDSLVNSWDCGNDPNGSPRTPPVAWGSLGSFHFSLPTDFAPKRQVDLVGNSKSNGRPMFRGSLVS